MGGESLNLRLSSIKHTLGYGESSIGLSILHQHDRAARRLFSLKPGNGLKKASSSVYSKEPIISISVTGTDRPLNRFCLLSESPLCFALLRQSFVFISQN